MSAISLSWLKFQSPLSLTSSVVYVTGAWSKRGAMAPRFTTPSMTTTSRHSLRRPNTTRTTSGAAYLTMLEGDG